jgi:hypothetical protein
MALGNANSSAQSRGKNKPVMVKRRKEVVIAKGYNSVTCSPVQASNACNFRGSLTETFYHSGNSALPSRSDVVYSTRRANRKTAVEDGNYKILVGGANYNMVIGGNGVVSRVDACRR